MPDHECPSCGCPLAELLAESSHVVSDGRVAYRRCVCGKWLVEINGSLVGTAGLRSA
ncbi:hypothetical protein HFP15_04570 [Amycolatopsis sp. K13G38]|uniref:Transcription factor zinc-finger domain-containing protein n=1 Tax=Amycolatopsis acididurans TaxID=2724524 RepID=A0ABX1IXC2_9PSEU|nr:hypothetical protein [Amycolatopsis acididurans]NKQ52152.1 hypothetical protein [Amycolatopsis acididurans]